MCTHGRMHRRMDSAGFYSPPTKYREGQKCHSLNAGPLSLGSWPRKKAAAQKVKGHRSKIPLRCMPTPLGNISAQNHKQSPYSYRILACTKKTAACPDRQTNVSGNDNTPPALSWIMLRGKKYRGLQILFLNWARYITIY